MTIKLDFKEWVAGMDGEAHGENPQWLRGKVRSRMSLRLRGAGTDGREVAKIAVPLVTSAD